VLSRQDVQVGVVAGIAGEGMTFLLKADDFAMEREQLLNERVT
jgi:hypothetical protein